MAEVPIVLEIVSLDGNSTTEYTLYPESEEQTPENVGTAQSCSQANRYRIDFHTEDIETIQKKLHLLKLVEVQQDG
jgi:hypothetical protein